MTKKERQPVGHAKSLCWHNESQAYPHLNKRQTTHREHLYWHPHTHELNTCTESTPEGDFIGLTHVEINKVPGEFLIIPEPGYSSLTLFGTRMLRPGCGIIANFGFIDEYFERKSGLKFARHP